MLDIEKIKRNCTRVSDDTFKKRVHTLNDILERDGYIYYENGRSLDEYIEQLCKLDLEELVGHDWEDKPKFIFERNDHSNFWFQSAWPLFYMSDLDFVYSLTKRTDSISYNRLSFKNTTVKKGTKI